MKFFWTDFENQILTNFINKKFMIQQKVVNIKIRSSSKHNVHAKICKTYLQNFAETPLGESQMVDTVI